MSENVPPLSLPPQLTSKPSRLARDEKDSAEHRACEAAKEACRQLHPRRHISHPANAMRRSVRDSPRPEKAPSSCSSAFVFGLAETHARERHVLRHRV